MNMKKLPAMLSLLLIILILVSACTKRNNLTGDNWSNVKPQMAMDSSFVMGYSYTNEGSVTGAEQHLLCGSDNGITAITVMQFTDIPEADTMTVISQPTLKLTASRRSPLGRSPLVLSFYKLAQDWAEDSTSTILDANMTPLGIPDFTVEQDTISSGGDTLTVNIPIPILEQWQTDDVEGYNIVVKMQGSGWIEFKSNEISQGPLLSFNYKLTGDTDTLEYSQRANIDSYKVTGTQTSLAANTWKLRNTLPQRMFFKFDVPGTLFKDTNNEVLDAADLKRMTVNKAELVLYVKNNPYYNNTKLFFYPYHVTMDTLAVPTALTDDDLETITRTLTTGTIISSDSVKIDITAIMQAYTSGDKTKNGIVVKTTSEMQNFGSVEFWHYNDAPAGKKPYIKIAYTPPYFKGN